MEPYVPAGHGAVQVATVRPSVSPYFPAGQFVHAPALAELYFPEEHFDSVALLDPAAHAYPAVHAPEQDAVVNPSVPP
jgi:hypothetical protein